MNVFYAFFKDSVDKEVLHQNDLSQWPLAFSFIFWLQPCKISKCLPQSYLCKYKFIQWLHTYRKVGCTRKSLIRSCNEIVHIQKKTGLSLQYRLQVWKVCDSLQAKIIKFLFFYWEYMMPWKKG
jgi:hypothetical protein